MSISKSIILIFNMKSLLEAFEQNKTKKFYSYDDEEN